MIKIGLPPFLECSSRGDKRFSAFHARIRGREFQSIEQIYQSSKIFRTGDIGVNSITGHMRNWKDAKGKRPLNIEYIEENRHLIPVLLSSTGFSDMFGQEGHICQAIALWKIRYELIEYDKQGTEWSNAQ